MKGKISIILMAGLVISFCSLTTLAKAEEQKAQLYMVWDIVANPSTAGEYEAACQEEVALYAKYKFPYSWHASSTNDFHYYFLMAVENYAAIDNIYKAFDEIEKKMGAKYKALMKRFAGTYEYVTPGMYYLTPELSYTPENPRLKPDEINFLRWNFFYIRAGMNKEAEEIAKKWVALYKSKNIPDGYNLFVGDIGTDMPIFVVVSFGENASDYFSQLEKNNALLGEEGMALWKKTFAATRKFETKTGMSRPDLSYIPKEK